MEVGPPEPPAQGEAPNRRKLRRHNGRGGERCGKGAPRERQVWIGKTNGSESLKTRREEPKDVETESDISLGISLGETCLLPRRHPAYRRRESDPGADVERGKLRPRNCERG